MADTGIGMDARTLQRIFETFFTTKVGKITVRRLLVNVLTGDGHHVVETVARQQAAIRELSTPVISVYDRVLLSPLIGTVDSHRAEQMTEVVLTRVVAAQALAIIIDIAGVQVVGTRVADHLLKTTSAVRLLGAETILTGITPRVAKTIVRLGVDISSMHTRSQLPDGIELALRVVGRVIAPTPS